MRIRQIKTILSVSTDGTVAFLHSLPLKECVVVLVVEEGAKQAMMTCHQIMCLKLKFICTFLQLLSQQMSVPFFRVKS